VIFLLIYDTKAGKLRSVEEFSDRDRASAMRALKDSQEAYLPRLEDVEIALFEAPSRATLERTHSRYFKTMAELGSNLSDTARRP